jgi:GxxExxY protein
MHEFTTEARKTRKLHGLVRSVVLFPRASEKPSTRRNVDDSPASESYVPVFREGPWNSSSIPPIRLVKRSSEQPSKLHRHLGPGLLESSYHTCLCRELELREISYDSQVALPLEYKGLQIAKGYVIDLLIESSLIVEIKSVDKLVPIHSAQLMTYMRLQRVSAGLLMNFNVDLLPHDIRRILR